MSSRRVHPNARRRPPVRRICAIEVADIANLREKVPADTPTIRRPGGGLIYFYLQPPGVAPFDTVINAEPGVNYYGDADARRLWERGA